ncbi:acyltransferase family protein [Microbacterium sp. bgisy203]|uniref:acyltransferase family protein n=1 Tax=Microbacterium sp. bgisy203 TaxID=3413799 RepID=UPI003D723DB6
MPSSLTPRFAGFDGLRAVAVLLVVVYHLFPAWLLHSGFVGVDVFFVISGFLITSLLLRERAATGRIGLRGFWTRRTRRLLPALALVVTVSATAAWLIGGDVLVGVGRQVFGAATFSYNWVSIAGGASYFSAAEPELFRNLWSLAVEEQFYVLWPLLLPALLLVRRPVARVAIALALAGGSALWGASLVAGAGLTRAYYGTDAHAFGLLIGVALAFALAAWQERAARQARAERQMSDAGARATPRARTALVAGLGIVALLALIAVASWQGGAALYPTVPLAASALTAVVIACALGSPLGRALDVAPLRWVGERSYGIYLWHWPVVVLLSSAVTGAFIDTAIPVRVAVAALLVTLVASALSYRFIEQPVRRLGFGGALRALRGRLASTPTRRFGAVAAVAAGALVVGGTTAAVAAAPEVTSSEASVQAGVDALREASAAPTPVPPDAAAPDPAPTAVPTPTPTVGPDGEPLPPAPASVTGDRVTAIGDSVMLASAGGLLDRLPGIQIDAAVSRSMWAGDDIVADLAAGGALRDYVVVGLGTNGPVDPGALQQIRDAIGPDRTLVLVNAFAPRDWIAGVNTELAGFAASHPRTVVADWSSAIAPHADLLAGDQIHPGEAGGEVYAATIADAVDAVESQRSEAAHEVALIRWLTGRGLTPAG